MNTHIKPTQEELEANAQKALEDAEALEAKAKEDENKSADTDEKKDEGQDDNDESDKGEDKKEDVDYKPKFIASTQEAQVLHSKQKKITQAVETAMSLPEPTEEELIAEFGDDWETMSTFERKLAKKNYINDKKFALLGNVMSEFKQGDEWSEKVSEFITDPKVMLKHTALEGKEADFVVFATKPSRIGVPLDDLVSAFLYENKPIKHKGSLLETGTGGSKSPPKDPTKLSVDQGSNLRKTDYRKYRELLKAGRIQEE